VSQGDKPLVWLHGEVKTPKEVLDACKRRLAHYDQNLEKTT